MAIDRIDWHYESVQDDHLSFRAGGTHIGMYLAWIILHRLEGENFDHFETIIDRLRHRNVTGLDVLIDFCDTKFWDSDLNDEGKAFTEFYYHEEYYSDYFMALASKYPSMYAVPNTWKNYDVLEPWIDTAYAKWKAAQ